MKKHGKLLMFLGLVFSSFALMVGAIRFSAANEIMTETVATDPKSTLTFTKACGGSGDADDGATWTVTSDASESSFESDRGIHYGTGSAAVSYLQLTTSGISGTISRIDVNASGASGTSAKLNVTVGGNAFDSEQSLTSSATVYTLEDSGSGMIVVRLSQTSAKKGLYVKSIAVTYSTSSVFTVTYNANGGSSAPTDSGEYESGDTVTVASIGSMTKTGYAFVAWNTKANGSGSSYDPDDEFEISGNVTLYAQWRFSPAHSVATEYVFTSKSWAATSGGSSANWSSGADGNWSSTQGVQVTTTNSGANATSPSAFTDVTGIQVMYSTNASSGAGTIYVTVGTNAAKAFSADSTGGTTAREANYLVSKESGSLELSVTCSTNSVYIKSIKVWQYVEDTHSISIDKTGPLTIDIGGTVDITPTVVAVGIYTSTTASVSSSATSIATVSSASVSSGSAATITGVAKGTATITFADAYGASEMVTIHVFPVEKNTLTGWYRLCTSTSDLEGNGHYIIGSGSSGSISLISTDSQADYRQVTSGSVDSSFIRLDSTAASSTMVFKLGGWSGSWTFFTKNYGGTDGYLRGVYNNNYLRVNSSDADTFTVSFSEGAAVITSAASDHSIRYNSSTTPARFSAYTTGQSPVYLYRQVDGTDITSLSIPSTYGTSPSYFYEGQSWTPTITYNSSAAFKRSEILVVSGGDYIDVEDGTITAKIGVMDSSSVDVVVRAHATDVANSSVYSSNCTITITRATVAAVSVTIAPTKTSYVEGQKLSLDGAVIDIEWNHGGHTSISSGYEGITTNPSLSTSLSIASHDGIEVSVTYQGVTSEEGDGFTIEVIAKAIVNNGLAVVDQTTIYSPGEHFVADGTLVVTYNDDTQDEFSIATLFAAGDVNFKIGGVAIDESYVFSDTGKVSIQLQYAGRSRSFNVTVAIVDWKFLTPCTSLDDLVDGDQYVICVTTGSGSSRTTTVMPSSLSRRHSGETESKSWLDDFGGDDVETMWIDVNSYGWTLVESGDDYLLQNADGMYLTYSGNSTTFVTTNDDDSKATAKWTITMETGGWFNIVNADATGRQVLYQSAGNYFAPYSTSNADADGYSRVRIYKMADLDDAFDLDEAIEYFVSDITCSGTGSYTLGTGRTWSKIADDFDELSDLQKAYFRHAAYNVSGEGTDTVVEARFGIDDDLAEYVSKYDFIVHKYDLTDFIGRKGTSFDHYALGVIVPPAQSVPQDQSPLTVTLWVVLGSGLAGLTAIGAAYWISKKRRMTAE